MHLDAYGELPDEFLKARVHCAPHLHDVDAGDVGDGEGDGRLAVIAHEGGGGLPVAAPDGADVANADEL